MLAVIGAVLEVDGAVRLDLADVRTRPVLLNVAPGNAVGIGPDAVGADIKVLRRGRDVGADAEPLGAARDRPDRASLALIGRLDDPPALGVDEVDHVGVDRAERREIGLGAVIAAHQPAEEAFFAAHRRIVEVDDQAIAGLDDEDGVLILVVEAHASQVGRDLPPFAVRHDLDGEAHRDQAVADFAIVVIGQQNPLAARQQREQFRMEMIGMPVGDPDVIGRDHGGALGARERPIERPAAEIAGAGQPRIGREHRPAAVMEQERSVAECLEAEAHGC